MTKPTKPYPDFPLYAHASGHWAKKIRGKTFYFGRWDDWEAALDRFNSEKDALYAGKDPNHYNQGLTIGLALDYFLSGKLSLVESGSLSKRTYSDYELTTDIVADVFGADHSVESLTAADFESLRQHLAKRFGPVRMAREIAQVRMIFRYCTEAGYIDKVVKMGPNFRAPSDREMRIHRAASGPKLFEPAELRAIIEAAKPQMKAMVLLGINCGFGNADCGQLRLEDLDLEAGWHSMARPKTGVARRARLWKQTVAAIQAAIEQRPETSDEALEDLVFVTKYRQPWFKADNRNNPLANEFKKLLKDLNLYRRGRTFYALRHTFETVAGDSRDQVAVDYVMGHYRRDMATVYRERIVDGRLMDVSILVERWLQSGQEGVQAGVQTQKRPTSSRPKPLLLKE